MLKKIFLPIILVLSLSGCATEEYSWVVKISEDEITPQQYVAAQMHSYVEVRNIADYSTDVLAGDVDGVSTTQWINDHTVYWLKRINYIETEFEKRGLKFGSEADEFIRIFAEEGWDSVSQMYKNNGLDFEHYREYLKMLYKEQLVFNSIFVYDEENKITDAEIEDYLANNISRVSYFPVARINDDGSTLDDEQDIQMDSLVADAVNRINSGEEIQAVAGDILTQSAQLLGSSEDLSDGSQFVTTDYITSSSVTLIFDFMQNFFEIPENECVSYKLDDCYYICQKRPLCDTQVEYMYLKQDVVNIIRDAEFEDMISAACEKMDVQYNEEAVKFYTPKRLKMTIE